VSEAQASGVPLVSVVVRTLDRPALLREALASLAAQSYRPLEVVIVNDGGTSVHDVVAKACGDLRLVEVTHPTPRGRAAAANAGVAAAHGEWVVFLDDDDLFLPGHVETVLGSAREAATEVAYAACRLDHLDEGSSEVLAEPYSPATLLLANYVPTCSVIVSRRSVLAAGGFDESLPFLEDWDLWLRLSFVHAFAFNPAVTSVYRVRRGTVGGDMAEERWAAMERLFAKHWSRIGPAHLTARLRRLEADITAQQAESRELRGAQAALLREMAMLRDSNAELLRNIPPLREELARLQEEHPRLVAQVAGATANVERLELANQPLRELEATHLIVLLRLHHRLVQICRRLLRRGSADGRAS
jgi:glycosyltransferase involved in cell wall biosynthesis